MMRNLREVLALALAPWLADKPGEWQAIADEWRRVAAERRKLQAAGRAMMEEAGVE